MITIKAIIESLVYSLLRILFSNDNFSFSLNNSSINLSSLRSHSLVKTSKFKVSFFHVIYRFFLLLIFIAIIIITTVVQSMYEITKKIFSLIKFLIVSILFPYMIYSLNNKISGKDNYSKITLFLFDKKIIIK